jgi:hypothetical protein
MRVLLGIFFSPLFFFICDIVSRLSTSARSHRGELISAIILSATRMIVRCVRWPSVRLSVVVNWAECEKAKPKRKKEEKWKKKKRPFGFWFCSPRKKK